MTACVSKLLKSRASLACFRARFLPGRAKDLSAPRYILGSSVPLLQRAARRLYTCYSIPLSVGIVRHRKRCIYTPKIKGSVGTQFILFNLNIFKTNFVIQLTCYNTYLLTPWCKILLEKLTGLQLVKKFPAFYGTRKFITALTSVRFNML